MSFFTPSTSTADTEGIRGFVNQDILGSNNGQRGSGTKRVHGCPAVPHTVFVCRGSHNIPERTVSACPSVFLKEGGIDVVTDPVACVVLPAVLGQPYALVAFIIQPVDLELIIRVNGIKIPAKH